MYVVISILALASLALGIFIAIEGIGEHDTPFAICGVVLTIIAVILLVVH